MVAPLFGYSFSFLQYLFEATLSAIFISSIIQAVLIITTLKGLHERLKDVKSRGCNGETGGVIYFTGTGPILFF